MDDKNIFKTVLKTPDRAYFTGQLRRKLIAIAKYIMVLELDGDNKHGEHD